MNEFQGPRIEKVKKDPRRGVRGLDEWAGKLLKLGKIGQQEHDDFIRKNNAKEKEMDERKLPHLRNYGFFNSVKEIKSKIKPQKGEKFIIRCTSKEKGGGLVRLLDATFDEVCEFAQNRKELPGGFEKWNVEVKEFVPTIAAGNIMVSPSGKTIIETWRGAHMLRDHNPPKYIGQFDPIPHLETAFKEDTWTSPMRFIWKAPKGAVENLSEMGEEDLKEMEKEDLEQMQKYAIKALRYIFPHLRPKPNEQIYVEYGVRESGEIYFIEANDSPLLTGR